MSDPELHFQGFVFLSQKPPSTRSSVQQPSSHWNQCYGDCVCLPRLRGENKTVKDSKKIKYLYIFQSDWMKIFVVTAITAPVRGKERQKQTTTTKNVKTVKRKYILDFLSHPKSSSEESHKNEYRTETANKTTWALTQFPAFSSGWAPTHADLLNGKRHGLF